MEHIILYDTPSIHKGDGSLSCYSQNVWKSESTYVKVQTQSRASSAQSHSHNILQTLRPARMALNYKKIPYTTEWSEYQDLGPKLEAIGIPPNPEGSVASYTVPTIRFENGSLVMDSLKIIEAIETSYPEPSLNLDLNILDQVTAAVVGAAVAVLGDLLYLCMRNCLSEASGAYNEEARKKTFGMSLKEYAVVRGGDTVWQEAEKANGPFSQLRDQLNVHKLDDGPFVLGSKVSYNDFVIAGFFECFSRADLTCYVRLMSFDNSFPRLHQACRPWLQRDT